MKRLHGALVLVSLFFMTSCMLRTVRERQAQICTRLATLNSTIVVLRRVNDRDPITTLRQAEARVSEAFREVKAVIKDAPEGTDDDLKKTYEDLEKAYNDLDQTVKAIPDQTTINQAIALISSQVIRLESASNRMQAGLRCPS
ncbi:hypothetical protein K9N68_35345 (plasmid) [Kovacikia minuta CCNUW1]|uniref:hypothetical protein n=1 Tax=Kovacikia minuta TaxID=2931930 RepID=UPI001CCA961C|nr:hypothetical protein [Kovacikia minuta]UBF30467.1 hypothetical protein K9N68_35345 [Kovacikia minuta CCNUW1]